MNLIIDLLPTSLLTFGIIFLAEIGDKSQLVCMVLAARYSAKPIVLGATAAFALLNFLAVTVGVSLTHIIPENWLTGIAAGLFFIFGLQALFSNEDNDDTNVNQNKKTKSIFLTTFLMIFLAELGDKTQLAIITISTTHSPIPVWLGATFALTATSLIGIFAGRKLLARLNIALLHKISGLFFILMACLLLTNL